LFQSIETLLVFGAEAESHIQTSFSPSILSAIDIHLLRSSSTLIPFSAEIDTGSPQTLS
jgi:hypothetical protein